MKLVNLLLLALFAGVSSSLDLKEHGIKFVECVDGWMESGRSLDYAKAACADLSILKDAREVARVLEEMKVS